MKDKIENHNDVIWTGKPSLILALPRLFSFFLVNLIMAWYKISFSSTMIFNEYVGYLYAFFFIVTLLGYLVKVMQLKTTVYTLKKDRLLKQRGILRRVTDELELFRVRDFQLDEPLLLRVFGLGNLVLFTSDITTSTVHLAALPSLRNLHEQMRKLVRDCWDERGVRELDIT